jgi:GDP-L-fucose synthase
VLNKNYKIYISGHKGMVGSACWRLLKKKGYNNLIGVSSNKLDLTNQDDVDFFFKTNRPDIVINAAAKVGGIYINDKLPYDFIYKNLQIQNNLINSSFNFKIKKFIFLGSSCVYPKLASQPISEKSLLSSDLEETNQWYAIAKISGIMMINALRKQYDLDYLSLMPTNLYGENDNFDLTTSHVLPALIRKFHEAKIKNNNNVLLWGTGFPMREFLHVDDLASAILFSLENNLKEAIYNVGSGNDISIQELALLIKNIVGFKGEIDWDKSKPDGTPRKLLNVDRLSKAGWKFNIQLEQGIRRTYEYYLSTINN